MKRPPLRSADLRGGTQLAIDAVAGVTDLVEAVHARVARTARLQGPVAVPDADRTRGLSALVYRSIRGVTRLVGGGLDVALAAAAPALSSTPGGPTHEAVLSALNGVLGHHLAATGNPLAIAMGFRHQGRTLVLEREALARDLPDAGPKLLVLVHGLCMNDAQWRREGHDHGAALAQDLGFTPVYLRYNTGRHVSQNGRELALQLQRLLDQWPQPVQRLAIVGHSMGGLVARSAWHQAAADGLPWAQRLDDLVFLGTPHHGAPLERAGHGVDVLLGAVPYAAPFARLGQVRSAGITDLRHGNLLETDWAGQGRFAHHTDRRGVVPLPQGPRCYAMAGTTGHSVQGARARLLGDGLVPLDSALGRHAEPQRCLPFPPERQWVGTDLHHLALLSDPRVYQQLRQWLGAAPALALPAIRYTPPALVIGE